MSLLSQVESILFVASKPLKIKQISKAVKKNQSEVEDALETLKMKYNNQNSGIIIISNNDTYQMASNPVNAEKVDIFIKDEVSGELTKAQLETLTVIAYRGPITKPELEEIRGVNCTLIIRNLLLRGLIEEKEDDKKFLPSYLLSLDAMRHLGIGSLKDLPNYEEFHSHDFIQEVLKKKEDKEK